MSTKYTTWGSSTGGCGHSHRTLDTAGACAARYSTHRESQGEHSDRVVREINGLADAEKYDARGPGRRVGSGKPADQLRSVQVSLSLTPAESALLETLRLEGESRPKAMIRLAGFLK